MQSLKENWLVAWKMTWGIWWILRRAVESLKICILVGYFWQKCVMFELTEYMGVVLKVMLDKSFVYVVAEEIH